MEGKEIVKVAESFVGQEEISGNQGFKNSKFQKIMESVGWVRSHAWCSYFGEVCWTLSVKDNQETLNRLEKLFSGSAVRTLQKFEDAGFLRSSKPVIGSLAIWQTRKSGKKMSTGHVGIVVSVSKDGKSFTTIEGNTNGGGGREGDVVAKKVRVFNWHIHSGLELQGFIHPIQGEKKSAKSKPFKTKKEGDSFREWFNDNYPSEAKEIDLDRSGSHTNKYILKAYEIGGKIYSEK
jgi:hypothetical protein